MKKNLAKKIIFWVVLPLLIITMAFLLWGSIHNDSATTDEPIHILSGYLSLKDGDYRLNPEHPFLGKQLIALPLLIIKPNLDRANKYFQVASDFYYDSWRESRQMAQDFLYKMGNNADQILLACRSIPIIFALVFALVLFWTGYSYFGIFVACASVFFYVFDPNIIAHARLANTDLWMMIFFFISIISFVYYLYLPNWKRLILAGICLGLALAVKFSAVILLLIIPLLWLIHYLLQKNRQNFWLFFSKSFLAFLMIIIIGFFIVWADYRFDMAKVYQYQPINESNFYSRALITAEPIAKFFKPSQYFKGIVFAYTNSYAYAERTSYLLGQIKYGGWWYYFPVAFLVKTPLPTIILLMLSIVFFIRWKKKLIFYDYVIIIPIVVYFLISLTSKLNIGIRHLLPIYPFLFLWIGNFVGLWYRRTNKKNFLIGIISILAIWYIYGAVTIYPHFLAYFNEIIGPKNGGKVLTDSNIDWGQDLKRLKQWLDDHKISQPILLEYFWTGNDGPDYYDISWQKLEPNDSRQKGYMAIGISALGNPNFSWLKKYQPITQIGYSINIYKID